MQGWLRQDSVARETSSRALAVWVAAHLPWGLEQVQGIETLQLPCWVGIFSLKKKKKGWFHLEKYFSWFIYNENIHTDPCSYEKCFQQHIHLHFNSVPFHFRKIAMNFVMNKDSFVRIFFHFSGWKNFQSLVILLWIPWVSSARHPGVLSRHFLNISSPYLVLAWACHFYYFL